MRLSRQRKLALVPDLPQLFRADMEAEIEKLSRLMSDELDAALFDAGLIPPEECLPYDRLDAASRGAIQAAARRVYHQLAQDPNVGIIRVVPHSLKSI